MIIERNTYKYIVYREAPLLEALEKISANKSGFVMVVSDKGRIEGILTDGDIRRWLSTERELDLNIAVRVIANSQFFTLPAEAPGSEINKKFDDRIRSIPLVDEMGHLVAIALPGKSKMQIGDRLVGEGETAYIIAEIGNNHNGDVELAKKLVELAARSGADCAKFQMRDMTNLYDTDNGETKSSHDLGTQYTLDLLAKYNLSRDALFDIFDHCHDVGIEPLCTPWDGSSLRSLEEYGIEGYKVASADLTNHGFLSEVASTKKPAICSTGMASEAEIIESVRLLRAQGAQYALLHCNSTYPAPYKDVNLNYIRRLADLGACPVGYSGHERGWFVPVAAIPLGVCIIEKHFTVDRGMEGNDHKVSLLPDELTQMVRAIRSTEQAMGNADQRELTQGEMINREILAKSLHAAQAITRGQVIQREHLVVTSPGQGLQPNRVNELVGTLAIRDIAEGTPFYPSDLDEDSAGAREFKFNRPWGLPVRWHDYEPFLASTNMDLLEYHLSYKDMDENLADWFKDEIDCDLVVHAPELFEGDHILDLANRDQSYRERSIEELQRVCDLTRELSKWHSRATRPMIVTNVGGFSTSGFLPEGERPKLYALVEDSLKRLDSSGVEIVPQTMPPFPWHFGGQSFHNLFVDPHEIEQFCRRNKMRICFDLSHSQLACNQFKWSMREFIERVGPFTAHLHIVDAKGVDGEGLQIGDGTMDFASICSQLNGVCPTASFVPEIWQGHKDNGAGFWKALDLLEPWLANEV